MEFKINRIGIVKKASIKLDGLTVIAGSNNSGKTTVGKALYSVVKGAENLSEMMRIDKAYAIFQRLKEISSLYPRLNIVYLKNIVLNNIINEVDNKYFNKNILFKVMLWENMRFDPKDSIEQYMAILQEFYCQIDDDNIINSIEDLFKQNGESISQAEITAIKEEWENNKNKAIEICEDTFEMLTRDSDTKSFAFNTIGQFLNNEFKNQIQTIDNNDKDDKSNISLIDSESIFFNISLINNTILKDISHFQSSYFERVFFVDDPFVIEDMPAQKGKNFVFEENESYVKKIMISSHREKMRHFMKSNNTDRSVTEELYLEEKLSPILEKINEIVPGTLVNGSYVDSARKVKVSNLATGSKIFSIIKKILRDGKVNEKTLLILDEPESHLHPDWIKRLAEVIVILVKECNLTILLTTHSPDFLLAVDAYMRKYKIKEKCNFYKTEREKESNLITYTEQTDSLNEVYSDFAKSFSEMNALRKKYMRGEA